MLLKIDATKPEENKIKQAAQVIKKGGLVVFPTETVYGIGADAFNGGACARIFEAKGRPSDNPLIVHVSSLKMAQEIGEIPEEYIDKIKKIWPSPITFILKVKGKMPKELTAGLDTIAVRMPAHPVALELIRESGKPIAAPSANPSKKPTATSGKQALKYFDGKVECVIDAGDAFFGIESTIIELDDFKILRPGPFTPAEIEKAFGRKPKISKVSKGEESAEKAISPGTKYQHYAPQTPLFLFVGKDIVAELDNVEEVPDFAFIGSRDSCKKVSEAFGCSTIDLGSDGDLYEVAKNLYNGLIMLDSLKVNFGIVESFNEQGIGLAIMNRIRKASSNKIFSNSDELSRLIETL